MYYNNPRSSIAVQFSCPDKIIVQHFLFYNFVFAKRKFISYIVVYYDACGRFVLHGSNVCLFSILLIGLSTDFCQLMSVEKSAFESVYDGRFTFRYQLSTKKCLKVTP